MEVHRGEVFYADLSPVVGSEQGGIRPVLIIQNEIGNRHSPTVILTEQIRTLDKRRLRERAGVIPPDDMRRVDEALGVSMGLESQDVHTNTGYF